MRRIYKIEDSWRFTQMAEKAKSTKDDENENSTEDAQSLEARAVLARA